MSFELLPPGFIACDALIGRARLPREPESTVADLTQEMERLHLKAAIVRQRLCLDCAPYYGNEILREETVGRDKLIPAFCVTPDGDEPDFDPALTVSALCDRGAKAVWMQPVHHGYSLQSWCSGELYTALQLHRLPLLLGFDQTNGDTLNEVLSDFPDLRVILLNVPRLGRNRIVYPLMRRHANLYLCCGPNFAVHNGLLDLYRNFGSSRLVLGTGYPDAEGGAGLSGLLYSGLPDEAIHDVGCGNIERLFSEVRDAG